MSPWSRSDLTAVDLGRALIYPAPHTCLTTWGDVYVVTMPGAVTRCDLTAGTLPGFLSGAGLPMPTMGDLGWLAGREAP